MPVVLELIGWAGTITVVAAFLGVSMGMINPGVRFQFANLAGSGALLINGLYHGALPSVAVNLAWFVISGVAIARTLILRRRRGAVVLPDETGDA